MINQLSLFILILLSAIAYAPADSYANPEPSGLWLDSSDNWNKPGTTIPQAPKTTDGNNLSYCQRSIRKASLPEDKQVIAAGWTLTGAVQLYEDTTVIQAMTDADGMCRPLNFQVFVFKEGQFAGTLSPIPMDSRTDGSLGRYQLYQSGQIDAIFSRYSPRDALCCASRTSRVFFQLETLNEQPVLVPSLPATTYPNE